jgi:hypothetical protein
MYLIPLIIYKGYILIVITSIWIFDAHQPFTNRVGWWLFLQVSLYLKQNCNLAEIGLGGDFAEFAAVQSHARGLISLDQREPFLKNETDLVDEKIRQLDFMFAGIRKVWVEGNHEDRLYRYLRDFAPALFATVSIENIFKLKERGWQYIKSSPNQAYKICDTKLIARHHPIGTSAKTTLQRGLTSVLYGHTHRRESFEQIDIFGQKYFCGSPGWMGQRGHPIFNYQKTPSQYNEGFAIVWIDEKTGAFQVEIVDIGPDGSCFAAGKHFKYQAS